MVERILPWNTQEDGLKYVYSESVQQPKCPRIIAYKLAID